MSDTHTRQSAVLWLRACMTIHLSKEQQAAVEGLFDKAARMEVENIIDAYDDGAMYIYDCNCADPDENTITGTGYYKNTYTPKK